MSDKKGKGSKPASDIINNLKSKLDNLKKSSISGKEAKSLKPADYLKMATDKFSEILKSSMTDKEGKKLKPTQVAYNVGNQFVNLAKSIIAEQQKGPRRPMKFPYTFSAKIAQFPWKFYFTHQWIYKHYAYAVIMCIPIFMYISSLSNSPNNVKVWKEIRRQEKEAHKHHEV